MRSALLHEDHYRRVCAKYRKTWTAIAKYHIGSGYGWAGVKNGRLLKLVASDFDVFITSDKNLRFQQNLAEIDLAVILLPNNQVPVIKELLPQIDNALSAINPRDFIEI